MKTLGVRKNRDSLGKNKMDFPIGEREIHLEF